MYENPDKRIICQHIFPDSHRCGSPALRGDHFCYYHHPTRKPAATRRASRGFTLTPPTDTRSLQRALSEVITRLAANQIDIHRARLLLHSLQFSRQTLGL